MVNNKNTIHSIISSPFDDSVIELHRRMGLIDEEEGGNENVVPIAGNI